MQAIKILADSTIPGLKNLFTAPIFELSTYSPDETATLNQALMHQDILLCRSTLKVTATLLENTPIQCVATASSGSDHIDKHYLKTHEIQLLDAKGSNAHAVADYMLCMFACLNINTTKTIGIMGMGHVGGTLAKRLKQLGYTVLPFDLPRMQQDATFHSCGFDEFCKADVMCIHANLHDTPPYPSTNLLDQSFFEKIKPNAILINAARGGIVDEGALLACDKPFVYCTDVYTDEPHINPEIIARATLCTPHIAGHSIEAKYRAVSDIYRAIGAHFNLALPAIPDTSDELKYQVQGLHAILDYYNPLQEAFILKQSSEQNSNLSEKFLALRKAHNFRHEFDEQTLLNTQATLVEQSQ